MRRSSHIYVCGSNNLLGQRRQDLLPLRCVERGDPCGVLEGGLELGHGGAGAHEGGHDALRGGGRLAEDGGTHEGCHCCGGGCAGAWRPSVRSPGRCSSMMSQWPRIAVEPRATNQKPLNDRAGRSCLEAKALFPLLLLSHVDPAGELQS